MMIKKILCSLLVTAALATPLLADETIAVTELPKEVVAAIQKQLPGSTLLSAEKDHENGKVVYDVKVRANNMVHEIELTPGGTILKQKSKQKMDQKTRQ